jgi:hypothetical protein
MEYPEELLALRRKIESLPFRALTELARIDDRPSRFLVWADKTRRAVESQGVWEETYEWRISTVGTQRIERRAEGYAATATAHGEFSAVFKTFPEAYEAMQVLFSLQTTLFYSVGWSTWDGQVRSRPRNDPERYLRQLSRAARADPSPPGSIVEVRADWSDTGVAYRVLVEQESLRMTTDAVNPERAAEFAGIYARLQADLVEMLDWRPLSSARSAG